MKDDMKIAFVTEHLRKESPFAEKKVMDVDIQRALSWAADRKPQDIMRYREDVITSLDAVNKQQWQTGECDAWLDGDWHSSPTT